MNCGQDWKSRRLMVILLVIMVINGKRGKEEGLGREFECVDFETTIIFRVTSEWKVETSKIISLQHGT